MADEEASTRLDLVLAAGELFSEHGFEAVSTRQIAQKAKANLGLIHYYFGSKENLYRETFRHVKETLKGQHSFSLCDAVVNLPEGKLDAEKAAGLVREEVFRVFDLFKRADKLQWSTKLLFRELANPSPMLHGIADELMREDFDGLVSLYRRVHSQATVDDAHAWSLILPGIRVLLHLMQPLLRYLMNRTGGMDDRFLALVAKNTEICMLTIMGISAPDAASAHA